MRSKMVVGAALLLALAACHRHRADEDTAPVENSAAEIPGSSPAPPVVEKEAEAPPRAEKVAAPPPAAPVSEDQQMADDADATGLTARVERNADDGDQPASEAPAQPAAENAE